MFKRKEKFPCIILEFTIPQIPPFTPAGPLVGPVFGPGGGLGGWTFAMASRAKGMFPHILRQGGQKSRFGLKMGQNRVKMAFSLTPDRQNDQN